MVADHVEGKLRSEPSGLWQPHLAWLSDPALSIVLQFPVLEELFSGTRMALMSLPACSDCLSEHLLVAYIFMLF